MPASTAGNRGPIPEGRWMGPCRRDRSQTDPAARSGRQPANALFFRRAAALVAGLAQLISVPSLALPVAPPSLPKKPLESASASGACAQKGKQGATHGGGARPHGMPANLRRRHPSRGGPTFRERREVPDRRPGTVTRERPDRQSSPDADERRCLRFVQGPPPAKYFLDLSSVRQRRRQTAPCPERVEPSTRPSGPRRPLSTVPSHSRRKESAVLQTLPAQAAL